MQQAFRMINTHSASSASCSHTFCKLRSSQGRVHHTVIVNASFSRIQKPRPSVACRAALVEGTTGKFISRTEVPAFIPRDDIIDQLYRWSMLEADENGRRNFGLPMKSEPIYKEDVLWGFQVSIFRDGIKLTDLSFAFDDLSAEQHEWIGVGENGFPQAEGKTKSVRGKNLEIWKLDVTPVDEDLRHAIRGLCTAVVAALNKYYAFGSVFVDDAQ